MLFSPNKWQIWSIILYFVVVVVVVVYRIWVSMWLDTCYTDSFSGYVLVVVVVVVVVYRIWVYM